MRITSILTITAAGMIACAPLSWAQQKSTLAAAAPLATPVGMTIKTTRVGQGVNVPGQSSNQPRVRVVFADASGLAIYTSNKDEPGKSTCTGECAAAWPPAVAPAGAKPMGDWSVITRDDGVRQWAFRSRPLYTFAKDNEGAGALGGGSPRGHDVDGHRIIEVEPEEWLRLPTGIGVEEVLTAPGQVLADGRRMTLYVFSGDPNKDKALLKDWAPVAASQLAIPVGDFSVIARTDGIYQWAVKGKPLYAYNGDMELGDSNGKNVDPRFQLAWVMHYFMPAEVNIMPHQRRGGVLVEAATGHALYARDRAYTNMEGGHNSRGGSRGNPATGKTIGLTGCDTQCEKVWKPLQAPADAQPSGYWSVFTRPDGSKQWGYQGYALYTFTEEKPGEITGHDRYDLTVNDSTKDLVASNLGLFWRVTSP